MVLEAASPGFNRIVDPEAKLDRIAHGHIFTEGPVWNTRDKSLVYVDIIGDTIWKWQPGVGATPLVHPSGKVNGLTYDRQGRLLIAGWTSRSITRMDPDGSIATLASRYQGKKLNTPNDIVVKSDGMIYFTDPPGGLYIVAMGVDDLQQYLDYSGVYKLDPESGDLTLVTDDVPGCNGLAFSADESKLYVNDTAARHIKVFDVKPDGTLGPGRIFAVLEGEEPGIPDGMKVDTEDNVYCTGPGGVWVMDSAGNYLGRILVPEHASNMAWADEDWKTFYITGRSSVFRIRCKIPGIPV
ncbi:MAG: SMP-30/gluconolactonase/LRE family protein [Dehalococcoidia bacterium]